MILTTLFVVAAGSAYSRGDRVIKVADFPDTPEFQVQARLGLTYLAMGQKGQALQVYRTLLGLDKKKAQELLDAINKPK
jgi:hypothetical protein